MKSKPNGFRKTRAPDLDQNPVTCCFEGECIHIEKTRSQAFDLVSDILHAAEIDYWLSSDTEPLENKVPKLFFKRLGFSVNTPKEFWKLIEAKERIKILRQAFRAKKASKSFEIRTSLKSDNKTSWICFKGAFDPINEGRAYGIILDETQSIENERHRLKVLREKEEISERLRIAMLETHHRVKNSFQLVRSLMNMELRGKDNLSRESVDRISSHLAGLGTIHDLLSAQAGKNNELDEVDLGELIVKLVSNLPSNSSERTIIECDEEVKISTRVASTFAVVANELLMNSAKHGKGEIKILCSSMTKQGQTCSVNITNYSSSKLPADTFQKLQPGAGLKLIKFLSKADFKQEATWAINGSLVKTELIIPIL